MSRQVRISHPELLVFSAWSAPGQTTESAGRVLSWVSEPLEIPTLVACMASFDDQRCFNSIQIDRNKDHPEAFPGTFRFEISQDGRIWEPILQESNYDAGPGAAVWHFPLLRARFLKFLFLADHVISRGTYSAAFGEFRTMISGIVDIEVTSELDRLWVRENLIDQRPEYGWSSSLRTKREEESIVLDLGSINRVSEIRVLTKNDPETFFPEVFHFSYSEDNIAWHHLIEENGFLSEPATWYSWRFIPTNMRFFKVTIDEGARTREGKYISQIIEMEFYASPDLLDEPGRSSAPAVTHASVLRSGIVRLAMDGESREGVVVQGSDRRLREATTETPGIVELASDGEERTGVVVQGHDRRLRLASEDLPGIVRLARDGEERAGHAVQGSDSRLRYSTEQTAGLVELASDGESRAGVAVQGSDRRLKNATVEMPGIVRLAANGSVEPNLCVQGDDHRLRLATSEYQGIVRFARHAEEAAETAVQGSDPRLRPATTETSGIVELARDGEDRAGVVVQGNDRRLAPASETRAGIVELAAHGSVLPERAVQGDDPRLSDPRIPLPHEHDYAPKEHDFSSHTGYLKLSGELGEPYRALVDPPIGHAPIAGINSGGGAGIVARGARDGLAASGGAAGVVGYSPGRGSGVVGAGKEGPGGRFFSERSFGLVAGGSDGERGLKGSELAFRAIGNSLFQGPVRLTEQSEGSGVIALYFPVESRDVLSPGDLMAVAGKGDRLHKSRDYASPAAVGVVVREAGLVLNDPQSSEDAALSEKPEGQELVAVAGVVQVQAVAEKKPIQAGDLLVASIRTGCVEKLDEARYRPGSIVARSLGELKSGTGLIRAQLLTG